MLIGQPIGLLCLVDVAVEVADNALSVVQSHVHAVVADNLLTHAPAQSKTDAHFVK